MPTWLSLPPTNVLYAITGVYLLLITAGLIGLAIKHTKPHKNLNELFLRIRTFWIIVTLIVISFFLTVKIAILFWAIVSFLALKEYFTLIPTRRIDRRILFWAYLSIPIQYYWVAADWYGMFSVFIPVFVFLFLPLRMVLLGEVSGFLRAISTIQWGVMMMVFCMSHIAALYLLPPIRYNPGGNVGMIFYLLFLNQFNDAAQFTWGKLFGKHKIAPHVSPKKTIEGFAGGVITTTALAIALAPLLTPFSLRFSLFIGIVIACSGFIGDIIVSALKRDLGIKDSGQLLPGHGGILDRIDSLMFTAPLFFHIVWHYYY